MAQRRDRSANTGRNIFYRSRLWGLIWGYILVIYLTLPVMRVVLQWLKASLGVAGLSLVLNVVLALAALALGWIGMQRGLKTLGLILIPLAIIGLIVSQLPVPEERVHFLQYGLLGILATATARDYCLRCALLLAVFVAVVGIGDEFIQWLLPNRVGDLRDVLMNVAAGTLGIGIGTSLFWNTPGRASPLVE